MTYKWLQSFSSTTPLVIIKRFFLLTRSASGEPRPESITSLNICVFSATFYHPPRTFVYWKLRCSTVLQFGRRKIVPSIQNARFSYQLSKVTLASFCVVCHCINMHVSSLFIPFIFIFKKKAPNNLSDCGSILLVPVLIILIQNSTFSPPECISLSHIRLPYLQDWRSRSL